MKEHIEMLKKRKQETEESLKGELEKLRQESQKLSEDKGELERIVFDMRKKQSESEYAKRNMETHLERF